MSYIVPSYDRSPNPNARASLLYHLFETGAVNLGSFQPRSKRRRGGVERRQTESKAGIDTVVRAERCDGRESP
jgi:hypothetical protein